MVSIRNMPQLWEAVVNFDYWQHLIVAGAILVAIVATIKIAWAIIMNMVHTFHTIPTCKKLRYARLTYEKLKQIDDNLIKSLDNKG